jgi:predicted metal-dependent peptidase
MRRKFQKPTARAQLSIADSYHSYLGTLMSTASTYRTFNLFADILSGLQVREDSNTKTFSIQISNGHYLMKYSPEMVKELDVYGAGIVIAHELGHAALGHVPRMIRFYDMLKEDPVKLAKAAAVIHVSADYALNSWLIDGCKIFSLQDLKCRVGKPSDHATYNGTSMGSYAGIHPSDVSLPTLKSLEWYVEELSSRIIEEPWDLKRLVKPGDDEGGEGSRGEDSGPGDKGEGGGEGGFMGKLMEAAGKMTDEQLEELMGAAGIDPTEDIDKLMNPGDDESATELADKLSREFIKRMQDSMETVKSKGTVPGNIEEWLDELTRPPEVDWKQELRNYAKSAKPSRKKTTLGRPRRRHILLEGLDTSDYPGKRKNPSYNIVFGIDTSGSVSNSELEEIFSELRGILDTNEGTNVTVVECDTNIGRIYSLEEVSDIDTKVSGRGGTSFDPIFQWVKGKPWFDGSKDVTCSKQPDLFIYATDGECNLPPVDIRIPQNKMLWLISSRGTIPAEEYRWNNPKPSAVSGFCDYGRYIQVSGE